MGTGKRQSRQLLPAAPTPVLLLSNYSVRCCCLVNVQRDSVSSDGMPDRADPHQHSRCATEDQNRSFGRIAIFVRNFCIGKLPQMGVNNTRRALSNQELRFPMRDECDETSAGCRWALGAARQFFSSPLLARDAESADGTNVAAWLARGADQGTQLHEGLVQI